MSESRKKLIVKAIVNKARMAGSFLNVDPKDIAILVAIVGCETAYKMGAITQDSVWYTS